MNHNYKLSLIMALSILSMLYVYSNLELVTSWGPGANYSNVSTRTTVIITDAYPEILNISCNSPVTLSAGTTKSVQCLVQIRDYNGGDTINGTNGSGVNATLYYYLNKSTDPDDNNVHYTNSSCSLNGTPNGYYVNWSCGFSLWYYANNGTWYVNSTVLDTHNQKNFTDISYASVSIQPLFALNVTELIDFGQLAVGDTSPSGVQANVTNFGNVNINVSLYAFGGDNETSGANLAMLCQVGNLSLQNEKYSVSNVAFNSMTSVTASAVHIAGLTIPQQQIDATQSVNSTYWRLHINVTENPYGQCNGTVVFSAEAP